MFTTVLIANRGEIALRVIRACRALGVRSVAIYTDLDRAAPHVREADDAVRVESYLDIDAVVAAAVESRAEAIHPGYGFLSERAAFARAVEEAGLTLVGPSADVMEQMGRKDAAREIAVAAGVPVVPSYSLEMVSTSSTSEGGSTSESGVAFPVLVKAAAGGGGKGMRIVRSADELAEAVAAARREAASAFGDDAMLVEKYVEHGRHIEVQVLADSHGNVVHLFERDCSPQRRHQKVLEEAPAPTIPEDARRLVLDSAVALARHVGYTNAGTVEFLLDADTGEAYFLEMNTRLQVEHPVTESVVVCTDLAQRATGGRGHHVDLVACQLRVAAGEPLPFAQEDLSVSGHAIEARVYAEDAYAGFLPQAGTAELVRWPGLEAQAPGRLRTSTTGVRVDHALESGQAVSTSYDPMLGKVIARGPDRESARRALVAALDDTAIVGLTTNTGFLRALAASDEFRDAAIDTAWLDRHELPAPDTDLARVFAAWAQAAATARTGQEMGGHPFQADGFRLGAAPAAQTVELDEVVTVDRAAGRVTTAGSVHDVHELPSDGERTLLLVDGRRHSAVVQVAAHHVEVVHQGQRHVFARPDVFGDHTAAAGDGTIVAPMPGTVLEVRVADGDTVAEGDVLGVMEAMKMELALTAHFAGTVRVVGAEAGRQVALGATLFLVEAENQPVDQPVEQPAGGDSAASGQED